jgi:hypothetical protein
LPYADGVLTPRLVVILSVRGVLLKKLRGLL